MEAFGHDTPPVGADDHRDRRCVPDEDLFFYSEGLLDAEATRVVSSHLRACESCSLRYLEEVELTVALKELPMPEPAAGWAGAVVRGIRTRREESSWWWIVAFGLLIASGAQWLIAADLSPSGAVGIMVGWSLRSASGLLALVASLGDLDTWERAARTAVGVMEAAGSSTSWSVASLAAAAMVALAANALLWSAARRFLMVRG